MPSSARSFRVFLSSTFEDLRQERDALQRGAFVNLRRRCREQGARFQPVDLRWGVREEAALDQRTMEICLAEIARCQRTHVKPNFLVLLGQRYGWQPLPSRIRAPEFADVVAGIASAADRALVEDWYRRDDNAVPAEQVLKARTGQWVDGERWRELETHLHRLLLDGAHAAALPAEALVKYEASATHQEILQGLGTTDEERRHVFVFCRDVPAAACDPQLIELQDLLGAQLPAGNLRRYSPGDMNGLCQAIEETLGEVIEAEIARLREQSALALEIETHDAFARERSLTFGREPLLGEIAAYLVGGADRPLVVHGAPGSGKTAVLARASEQARVASDGRVVVSRFVGASPGSSSGASLLRSVGEQIAAAYGVARELPVEYEELARAFRDCLALASVERPLVLFVDGLDQLAALDPANSLSWLGSTLAPGCKVVVSTNTPSPATDGFPRLEVGTLSADAADSALDSWLAAAGRTLREEQRRLLLDAFARSGLPLYLKLAFEEARLWDSHLPPDRCRLGETVEDLLDVLFDRLSRESEHGPVLVSRSVGYLAAARHGLSEGELLDVLSADNAVLGDFIARSPTERAKPEAERLKVLPLVVWSRLFHDLEPYLTESQAEGLLLIRFYHGQLRQVAAKRRASEMPAFHHHLASVFERGCVGDDGHYRPARRAIGEMPYHYRMAQDTDTLARLYADMSFLCAYVAGRDAFALSEEARALPDGCIEPEVQRVLRDAAAALTAFPLEAPQLLYKELSSERHRRQAAALAARPWIRLEPIRLEPPTADGSPGIAAAVTRQIDIQARCVAPRRSLAFLHTAADLIEVVSTLDLRPRGQIRLDAQPPLPIRMLLCDDSGALLALVRETGAIEVLKTQFAESGELLGTMPVHRGACLTGRFGALAACALPDGIVYQAPDRSIMRLALDGAGSLRCQSSPPDAHTLTSCSGGNVSCLTWRDGSRYVLTLPESGATLALTHRPLAVCRFGATLAVSTDEGGLRLHDLPGLELRTVVPSRLPILSMSPTEGGVLLMTDRHGNILTLDAGFKLTEHGRCTQDLYDDYPSVVQCAGEGAFYVSQRRCVALEVGGPRSRAIQSVAGTVERPDLLTYSRARGFELRVGSGPGRALEQDVVGGIYEFEYSKFRVAWSASGVIAYTTADCVIRIDDGRRSTVLRFDSGVVSVVHHGDLDVFLVLTASGRLYVLDPAGQQLADIQGPRSENGLYLMESCGAYVCIVAFNVLVRSAYSSTVSETVLVLRRLTRAGAAVTADEADVQHISNTEPRILSVSYDRLGNSLCLMRDGCVERWRLDAPARHDVERIRFAGARDPSLRFCAGEAGAFYADVQGGLCYQSLAGVSARVPGFRTVTYVSPSMDPDGYLVEDNSYLYHFTLEQQPGIPS